MTDANWLFEKWIDYLGRRGQANGSRECAPDDGLRARGDPYAAASLWAHLAPSFKIPEAGGYGSLSAQGRHRYRCEQRNVRHSRRQPHIPVWPMSVAWL